MEKRSRRRIRDLVALAAFQGLSQNEIGCARISMMAGSTNAPFKGRIQKRKTNHLQIIKSSLQRTAGPYNVPKRWSFDHLAGAAEQKQRHSDAATLGQSVAFFRPPDGISALETRAAAPTLSLGKRGIPAKQEALLISDWQRQCPRPMVQMKPVMQPADGGKGAIPYCWSWPLDFLFLAPPRAHCIMRCGR
jgi:hypothetical protein